MFLSENYYQVWLDISDKLLFKQQLKPKRHDI